MRCVHCGAALRPGETWCGLCLHQVSAATPAAPAVTPAVAVVESPPAPPASVPPPRTETVLARAALAGGYGSREWTPPPPELAARLEELYPAETPPAGNGAGGWAVAAILLGGAFHVGMLLLARTKHVENATAIAYGTVATVALYAAVAGIVIRKLRADRHPLRWRGRLPALPSALIGMAVGVALGYPALSGAGKAVDPAYAWVVREADPMHVAAAVLLAMVLAPVIEEVLFRGLLLASLVDSGLRYALGASAFAFAVWHLRFDLGSLKYYVVAGLLLGFLYVKGGLSCSMAMHAAFNGMLVAAAVVYVTAPGPTVTAYGVTVHAARGWHDTPHSAVIHLAGPSAAELVVLPPGVGAGIETARDAVRAAADGRVPGISDKVRYRAGTARLVHLPYGDAARVTVTLDGRSVDLVVVPTGRGDAFVVLLAAGGSARARTDLDEMLQTLRIAA